MLFNGEGYDKDGKDKQGNSRDDPPDTRRDDFSY